MIIVKRNSPQKPPLLNIVHQFAKKEAGQMDKKKFLFVNFAENPLEEGRKTMPEDFVAANVQAYGRQQMEGKIIFIRLFCRYLMNVMAAEKRIFLHYWFITRIIIIKIMKYIICRFYALIVTTKYILAMVIFDTRKLNQLSII